MAINKIQDQFFQQQSRNHVLQLREGQIIEGKIEQLYTDDKARVKIGSSTLIAQIETALSVGQSYYFQVNEKNDQVYLQVVQADSHNRTANLDSLLNQLQVKPTKINRQFIEQLITQGIPFNRTELEQALTILNQQGNKGAASDVLQNIFQAKLPITENVYQALTTFNTTDFTTLLQSIYHSLQQNNLDLSQEEAKLMKLIQSFVERPQTIDMAFIQSLLSEGKQDNTFVRLLQMMGILDVNVSPKQIIAQLENDLQNNMKESLPLQQAQAEVDWQQLIKQLQTDSNDLLNQQQAITRTALTALSVYHQVQNENLNEQALTSLKQMITQDLLPLLPGQMSEQVEAMLDKMTLSNQKELNELLRIFSNQPIYSRLSNHVATMNSVMEEPTPTLSSEQQLAIKQSANQLLQQFSLTQDTQMNEQEIKSIITTVTSELLPLLPNEQAEQVTAILNKLRPENQSIIMNVLHSLANSELDMLHVEPQSTRAESNNNQQITVQQQLLSQISQYMQSIGLTMEHDMMQAIQTKDLDGLQASAQTETIKSLLLQLVQQGGQQTEQIQQLIHFINGLQLQTLTETNQMLQAQLYIPGNPFALNDDIFMKFEGKKTDDQQIDADYCRIIFMLDLQEIDKTIVDMQIQKRVITVTIYNDIVSEVTGIKDMRQEMKNNLQAIDYQLSTVEWKPLSKQQNEEVVKQAKQNAYDTREGFDFKI